MLRRVKKFVLNVISEEERKTLRFSIFSFFCTYLECLTFYPSFFQLSISELAISDSFLKLVGEREGAQNLFQKIAKTHPKALQEEGEKLKRKLSEEKKEEWLVLHIYYRIIIHHLIAWINRTSSLLGNQSPCSKWESSTYSTKIKLWPNSFISAINCSVVGAFIHFTASQSCSVTEQSRRAKSGG